jgi:hypothetical protein
MSGCDSIRVIELTVLPQPLVDLGPDIDICTGSFAELDAGDSGMAYQWSTLEITQQIVVSNTGQYSVTVTNSFGCSSSDAVFVNVVNPAVPTIQVQGPSVVCAGQSVTLFTPSGVSQAWSNGATGQTVQVTESGPVHVTVTDVFGCNASSQPVMVTVNPLPTVQVEALGATALCPDQSVTLTVQGSWANVLWMPGSVQSPNLIVSSEGSYTASVTDPMTGCTGISQPISITTESPLSASILANSPLDFCQGGNVLLSVQASGPIQSYQWSNGSVSPSITVTATGNYWVALTGTNGCVNSSLQNDPVIVTVFNPVPEVEQMEGSVMVTNGPFASYQWLLNGSPIPGATTDTYTPIVSGNYMVSVVDGNGCFGSSVNTEFTFGVGVQSVSREPVLTVIPNPSNGTFVLRAEEVTGVVLYRLFDASGREVAYIETNSFGGSTDVEFSGIASGIYMVTCRTDRGLLTNRAVVY